MKVIFVSTACSRDKYREIFNSRKNKFIDPAQKFLEQLMRGVAENAKVDVISISILPVSSTTISKKYFSRFNENIDNINYIYPSFFNGKILRYFTTFFSTFHEIRKQIRNNNNGDTIIITDPLSYQTSVAARLAGKLSKIKTIAIITDIPTYATGMKNHGYSKGRQLFQNLYEKLTLSEIYKYEGYINLTSYMNKIVNPNNKPSIVIEGSIDTQINNKNELNINKKKIYLYAGGLYEKYGVGNLVEAFVSANLEDTELHLYGSGSYVKQLEKISMIYDNVKYKGCVLNTDLIEIEKKSDLLINPRFSNEEYTKLSFPSKTLEYMTTGTPVLSTRLAGIPSEYQNYLFWFNGESVDEMRKRLIEISLMDDADLKSMGKKAREFVFKNKTNLIQGYRIVEFINKIQNGGFNNE